MGLRFRRSLSIFPGLRLNFSKSGISTSIGPRGATLNFGSRGARYTVGLPGTGLSYTQRLPRGLPASPADVGQAAPSSGVYIGLAAAALIFALVLLSGPAGAPATDPAPASSTPAPAFAAEVGASALRCRADPSIAGAVVATLARGTRVQILEEVNGWSRVASPASDCWVASRFIVRLPGSRTTLRVT